MKLAFIALIYSFISIFPLCGCSIYGALFIDSPYILMILLIGYMPFWIVSTIILLLSKFNRMIWESLMWKIALSSVVLSIIFFIVAIIFNNRIVNEIPDELWGLTPSMSYMYLTTWLGGYLSGIAVFAFGAIFQAKKQIARSLQQEDIQT
ncbi:MAG: hypothetical protein RLP44_04655 [Aggregatilineales bacterium]